MASGKTTVGREVARRLDAPLVDLDARIEERAGRSVADIFAVDGEAAFRALEADVLRAITTESEFRSAVVATGGGTACSPGNMERMRASGLVVALTADFDLLLERARGDGGSARRPLYQEDEAGARALYLSRESAYRRAHAVVDTGRLEPSAAARSIEKLVSIANRLGERLPASSICAVEDPYAIVVGSGALDSIGALLAELEEPPAKVAVVTDENVGPLYLARAVASLSASGCEVVTATVPAGEPSKSPERFASLAGELAGSGLDRKSAVVALGGGVVGDLAGFVAATLFRGVHVVQVPTTLLAMTDSAIGGKTGVNLAAGKNLLGAFWQPKLVVCDPALLATLPPRELRAGIGELYKYGLLDGEELYDEIDAFAAEPTDPCLGARVIARATAYKAWVVARDERETRGERILLNLGHTIGHAIERAAGYGVVLHGEAVALGLLASIRVSVALGLMANNLEPRVRSSLARAGLDVDLDAWLTPSVLAAVGVDKKRTGAHVRFVALSSLGNPTIVSLPVSDLSKILLPSQSV